jgi:hypothetical protein
MSFIYSCFFSYRRNPEEKNFLKNFNSLLESAAHLVTNKTKNFFDETEIKQGQEFDKRIYESISKSYFFVLMYVPVYLHKDNDYCARELYRALEVEKRIKEKVSDYCFIMPFMQIGNSMNLPNCINKMIAISLRQLRTSIINKKHTTAIDEFKNNFLDNLEHNFKLIKNIDFGETLINIPIPEDKDLHNWIDEQNGATKTNESKQKPLLKN